MYLQKVVNRVPPVTSSSRRSLTFLWLLPFSCSLLFLSVLTPRLPSPAKVPHTSKRWQPFFRSLRKVVEICPHPVRVELFSFLQEQMFLEVLHRGSNGSFRDLSNAWTFGRGWLLIIIFLALFVQPRRLCTGVDVAHRPLQYRPLFTR